MVCSFVYMQSLDVIQPPRLYGIGKGNSLKKFKSDKNGQFTTSESRRIITLEQNSTPVNSSAVKRVTSTEQRLIIQYVISETAIEMNSDFLQIQQ